MPRPKQTVGTTAINISLPDPIAQRLAKQLHSEVDGRIPVGAYKQFFTGLLEQYWAAEETPCGTCGGTGVKGLLL